MKQDGEIIVIYHKNCLDGFGAAWAAWVKFGNKAKYIATDPHILPSEIIKNKEVYIVDNSYSREILAKLSETNKKVVVIDHHKTAQVDVESFSQNIFDNNHSGAVLAWNYFHPKKKIPVLLRYIEDNDLWKFKLPHTHMIRLYVTSHSYDFSKWNALSKKLEISSTRKRCIEEGRAISRYVDQVVGEIVDCGELVQFGKFRVYVVNSPSKKVTSVIGHALAEKTGLFGAVWYESRGNLHVSLRSVGEFDVSKIAVSFGGGGHKNAAAFTIPFSGMFPWKSIKKTSQ